MNRDRFEYQVPAAMAFLVGRVASALLLGGGVRRTRSTMASSAVSAAVEDMQILARSSPPFRCIETASCAQTFLDAHDAFLFDCDGVLWRGDDLLPNTIEALQHLDRLGKRSVFVTNNAAKSRAAYAARFAKLGLKVSEEQVVPSSFVAARWLARCKPDVTRAFVIGSSGLVEELREAGIEVLTASDFVGGSFADNEASGALTELAMRVAQEPSVGAVVVGHDTSFDFRALCLASLFLERSDVCFLATNPDAYDMVAGHRMPGNGCFVAAVATAAGRPPDAVCGKPNQDLADYLLAAFSLDPARTCMIGDRLDTDIALGHAMGASSLLVLTGVASSDEVLRASGTDGRASTVPTHAISHVGRLVELIERT